MFTSKQDYPYRELLPGQEVQIREISGSLDKFQLLPVYLTEYVELVFPFIV